MNKYSEQELHKVLGQELEVPEAVEERLQTAYDQIRKKAVVQTKQSKKRYKKKYIRVLAVSAAALCTITVCAATYFIWDNRLTEKLQIDEEQQKVLEDTGMAVFSGVSCTDAGVTVTALQCITDQYYTHLNFKVEGYAPAEGTEPGFQEVLVSVDGNTDFNWNGSFYDGLVQGNDGMPIYADGEPLQYNEQGGIISRYTAEDGSLEYHMVLSNSAEKGFFIGKPIHVAFKNIGTMDKAECIPDLEGEWQLDWTLGGADTARSCELEVPLGDTGAIVRAIDLSSVSIRVLYDFPRIAHTEKIDIGNGQTFEHTSYEKAPEPIGVRFKDGSALFYIYGGPGTDGFVDETSESYINTFAFDRVIDAENVEAVLFVKEYPDGLEPIREENCYAVSLNEESDVR